MLIRENGVLNRDVATKYLGKEYLAVREQGRVGFKVRHPPEYFEKTAKLLGIMKGNAKNIAPGKAPSAKDIEAEVELEIDAAYDVRDWPIRA